MSRDPDDTFGAELDQMPGLTPSEMKPTATSLARSFHPVLSQESLFLVPAEELSLEEATYAHVFLKFVDEELFGKRRKEIRLRLLDLAQTQGTKTKKGGHEVHVAGTRVLREVRRAKELVEKKVRALLERKGLKPQEAFSRQVSWALDHGKLEALVKTGKLTQDELDKCKRPDGEALRVQASEEVQELLDDLRQRSLPDPDEM